MTLVYLSLALIIGIYFGSYLQLPITVALPIIASALLISILWRKNRPVLLGGICIALFLCGALRYGTVSTGDALQSYIGKGTVSITGVVVDEPEPVDSSTKLVLSAREINGQEIAGTLLIRTTRYPLYEYGDLLVIRQGCLKPVNCFQWISITYIIGGRVVANNILPLFLGHLGSLHIK